MGLRRWAGSYDGWAAILARAAMEDFFSTSDSPSRRAPACLDGDSSVNIRIGANRDVRASREFLEQAPRYLRFCRGDENRNVRARTAADEIDQSIARIRFVRDDHGGDPTMNIGEVDDATRRNHAPFWTNRHLAAERNQTQ